MFYLLGLAIVFSASILLIGLAGRGPRPTDYVSGKSGTTSMARRRPKRPAVDDGLDLGI